VNAAIHKQAARKETMNHTIAWMQKNGIEVTRENYLFHAYLGDPPEVLGPEEEADLPEELREETNEDN
jgi:hypothetical protein